MTRWIRTIAWTLLAMVTLVLIYPSAKTTFDIAAEVESLTFTPLAHRDLEWKLDGVRLRRSLRDTGTVVSGTLALSDSVKVLIERKSLGPLRLGLESRYPQAEDALLGTFTPDSAEDALLGTFSPNRASPIPLRRNASLELPDLEGRAREGRPVVLFAEGAMSIGWVPNDTPEPSQPLLRRGTVTMIGSSWFRSTSFPAGTAELRAGDRLEIEKPLSAGVGFISADERPALTVGFRTVARSATVMRPRGGTPKIATSLSSTRLGDPVLKSGLAILLFLVPMLAHLPAITEKIRSWMRDRRAKKVGVPAAVLCIMVFLPGGAFSQSVALQGVNAGQGITRPRGPADCFIVTPLHVVGRSARLRAISEGGVEIEATPRERYESADLAVLEFDSDPSFPCPEWNVPDNLDDLLVAGANSAVLQERDDSGDITFTPVWITSVSRQTIRVSPRAENGEIKSGMSGSQLMVNGQFAGILQSVRDNGRIGTVMRSDDVVRVLGNFFTTRMSPVASDAVNLTLTKGESTVLGDQHTVFGYFAGNGPQGIWVRLDGVEHQMGPGTRLTFPDSRRNCAIILIRFEEVQGISWGGEKADFRIACTSK